MRKYIPYFVVFTALIILLALFAQRKPSITGNATILSEISRIEQLSVQDEEGNSNLTSKDLAKLKELVKGDKVAESYVNELEWLINNGEDRHILHSTLFMREYIKAGKDVPCVPHELWHIALFVRHGDMEYAKKQAKNIEKGYAAWERSIEMKRKAYPQFYKSLDELKHEILEAIAKLKTDNYSESTLEKLELIGSVGLC